MGELKKSPIGATTGCDFLNAKGAYWGFMIFQTGCDYLKMYINE